VERYEKYGRKVGFFLLFLLPFFCIFHIFSQFNLLFFCIFYIFSLFSFNIGRKASWIVKRYEKYGRNPS
jgi:hypothetical protein